MTAGTRASPLLKLPLYVPPRVMTSGRCASVVGGATATAAASDVAAGPAATIDRITNIASIVRMRARAATLRSLAFLLVILMSWQTAESDPAMRVTYR